MISHQAQEDHLAHQDLREVEVLTDTRDHQEAEDLKVHQDVMERMVYQDKLAYQEDQAQWEMLSWHHKEVKDHKLDHSHNYSWDHQEHQVTQVQPEQQVFMA